MKKLTNAKKGGFSLIELMVAMGILSVLMLMLTVLLEQIQKSWRFSESRISQFREARVAFDVMTKNIGQASLNTYWDLKDEDGDGVYDGYFRTSELHFATMKAADLNVTGAQAPVGHAVFFQAPLGFSTEYRNLNNLFNGRGYFVAFGGDKRFKPSFVKTDERFRFRLMEFRPPAESNQIFDDGQLERAEGVPQVFDQWYRQAGGVGEGSFEDHLNPLAENIISLFVSPRDSLESVGGARGDTFSKIAPEYEFDSNTPKGVGFEAYAQQIPPLVRVTMIAIDEAAAVRYENGQTPPAEFTSPFNNRFEDSRKYDEDIEVMSRELNDNGISHKVFSSLVMLRSSKWSI